MVEAMGAAGALVEPGGLGRLEQTVRADDIGRHKGVRASDGSVDMAFRREMNDRVDIMIGHQLGNEVGIANVADDQFDVGHIGNVGRIACIGQRIEDDDTVIGRRFAPMTDEIRADETGSSSDDQIGHMPVFRSLEIPTSKK